tara:strand:- start:73 stop:1092 length:1020 start_codon:yes stop_codon:yes gene_type:complete
MGLKIEYLKFVNLTVILPIMIFFYKSINLKYPRIDNKIKIYLISILFLSPTIRTLLVWPYPFIWALAFFIISIYFYLKFEENKNTSDKFKYSIYNIFFLALAAYFTPNFGVFSLFFFYKFYFEFKNSKKILGIIILNIFLALPALSFLISRDFYFINSMVVGVDTFTKFNIANKIIIISSFIILFLIPLLPRYSELKNSFSNLNISYLKIFFLIIFISINIYFYNFIDNVGGGLFYHLSNMVFKNSLILHFVFFISVFFFYFMGLCNFNNILIFITLIIYNMQFSIYYKYFDPLLLFIILFLFKFKQVNFINLKIASDRYLVLYIIFLGLSISKLYVNY